MIKLKYIRSIDDDAGGLYMPTVVFKHDSFEGELHITNSFYGASACLNSGSKYRNLTMREIELSQEEIGFMWDMFKLSGFIK